MGSKYITRILLLCSYVIIIFFVSEKDIDLISFEKLRASPELWPQSLPGISEFAKVFFFYVHR